MNPIEQTKKNGEPTRTFASICLGSCQKILAQIEKTKTAILTEFRDTLEDHGYLLRLALNEAEALARQTDYPHLIFPTLALEKAQAVAAWHSRQRTMRETDSVFTIAA